MWKVPKTVILTSGFGIGSSYLRAFDEALLNSDIGDFNLIQVSSIFPANAKILHYSETGREEIKKLTKGMILPTVYAVASSDKIGETISVAISIGIPKNSKKNGVIFEANKIGKKEEAEEFVDNMAKEALTSRGIDSFQILTIGSELTIRKELGCVVCAAVLLP